MIIASLLRQAPARLSCLSLLRRRAQAPGATVVAARFYSQLPDAPHVPLEDIRNIGIIAHVDAVGCASHQGLLIANSISGENDDD